MILPPATIGILGGGQLGRYFVMAAQRMGYRVVVYDPDAQSVAAKTADAHIQADWTDANALLAFAKQCSAITTEFENVPAQTMEYLAQFTTVHPSADAVAICQHRSQEKAFLVKHGIPIATYADIQQDDDLSYVKDSHFPAILKLVSSGYDGKGQQVVKSVAEAREAFIQFGRLPCVLEKMIKLDGEISVVLARTEHGDIRYYPPAKNEHRNGILAVSVMPAPDVAENLMEQAKQVASQIAFDMNYVGTLAVEFFISGDQLLVNEIAPRPHNSGHTTLDICPTSQFEQQVRALCGLPLGDTTPYCTGVMINLLGDRWFTDGSEQPHSPAWEKVLTNPKSRLHLYGKSEARIGRKMGHVTLLADQSAPLSTQVHALEALI